MSSPVPIALPKDFMNMWSDEKPLPLRTKSTLDPFRDPSNLSRVTASGYTESDVTIKEQEKGFKTRLDQVKEQTADFDEMVRLKEELMRVRTKPKESNGNTENSKPTGNVKFDKEMSVNNDDLLKYAREVDRENERMCRELEWMKLKEKEDKYRSLSDFKEFTKQVASTVYPSDSASNIHHPMRQLSMKSPQSRFGSLDVLEEESALTASNTEQLVVGGYMLSSEDKLKELDVLADIKPVNGLPIIFTNPRLNFLTHIHDALFKILTDSEGRYPSENCLELLMGSRRRWGSGPSIDLLETVIDSTIDTKSGTIKANPFNLPVIEVTMQLSQREMYMSLDLLHKEFEIEWFNTLKSVTTPKFQSKYESMKFKRVSHRRESSGSSGKTNRSSSSSAGRSRRSSGHSEGSIMSFFSGR